MTLDAKDKQRQRAFKTGKERIHERSRIVVAELHWQMASVRVCRKKGDQTV